MGGSKSRDKGVTRAGTNGLGQSQSRDRGVVRAPKPGKRGWESPRAGTKVVTRAGTKGLGESQSRNKRDGRVPEPGQGGWESPRAGQMGWVSPRAGTKGLGECVQEPRQIVLGEPQNRDKGGGSVPEPGQRWLPELGQRIGRVPEPGQRGRESPRAGLKRLEESKSRDK